MANAQDRTIEDVLDELAAASSRLNALRTQTGDQESRDAIGSQINAITKWFLKLDAVRVTKRLADGEGAAAAERLTALSKDLRKVKSDLEGVAKGIGVAARIIGVAEKIFSLAVPA